MRINNGLKLLTILSCLEEINYWLIDLKPIFIDNLLKLFLDYLRIK